MSRQDLDDVAVVGNCVVLVIVVAVLVTAIAWVRRRYGGALTSAGADSNDARVDAPMVP